MQTLSETGIASDAAQVLSRLTLPQLATAVPPLQLVSHQHLIPYHENRVRPPRSHLQGSSVKTFSLYSDRRLDTFQTPQPAAMPSQAIKGA